MPPPPRRDRSQPLRVEDAADVHGWTARNCTGAPGPDAPCAPQFGTTGGTLPWYYENGLVSIGDPAVSIGPRPDSHGHFSWSNGPRLYFSQLAGNFAATRTDAAFRGFYASPALTTFGLQPRGTRAPGAWGSRAALRCW
jgi:hypothetical protein